MNSEYTPGLAIMLHLRGRQCLVIGGGAVAAAKVLSLVKAGGQVTVLSPTLHSKINFADVRHIPECYKNHSLKALKPYLVVAATDNAQLNEQIVRDSQARNMLVSAVTANGTDDFHSMSVQEHGAITVAVSTNGQSPTLSKHLQTLIADLIGDHYPILAQWLGELRPQVQQHIADQAARRAFWQRVLHSDVVSLLEQGKQTEAYDQLMALYNQAIQRDEVLS